MRYIAFAHMEVFRNDIEGQLFRVVLRAIAQYTINCKVLTINNKLMVWRKKTMSLSVALQLYSIRNEMAKDFTGTLQKVKEMGYDGVEFAGLHGKVGSEVKKTLEQIGLTPVSAHVSLAEIMADPKKTMETYAEIGVKYMAIPYLPGECRPASGNFEKTLSDMRFACEQAKAHGITMLYHNHDFEFELVDGEYYLDTIYKTIPADLLQTEIDTCWVNVAGEEPSAYVLKYKGRAPVVHLKDFTMKGRVKGENLYELIGIQSNDGSNKKENFSFRPVGSGVQDVPEILAAAEEAGASWVTVEQDQPAEGQTEMESAELSRNYLRTLNLFSINSRKLTGKGSKLIHQKS